MIKQVIYHIVAIARQWWCKPLVPALERQRQAEFLEFEASLIYRVSSTTARATQRNTISKKKYRGNI